MIRKLLLKNYRCFAESEITFRGTSVVVGSNNAGKSTLIEALRIVGNVAQRFKNTNYAPAPQVLGIPAVTYGIKINIENLKIDLRTIVHQYQEDVFAQISAFFDDDIRITVYLSPDLAFATIEAAGERIRSKTEARKLGDLNLHIMPQIGLIREDEPKLAVETIQKDISTRLSSRHFRNELYLYKKEYYQTFQNLAQATWPGLRINDLWYDAGENKINLMVYDAGYAAEIGLMGSGLQMWLQIIWFISKCPPEGTIVLDEPDVYMHPDLQRKVLRIVQNRFCQIIIATHSVEIISDVEPYQIVTIDKKNRRMRYATDSKAVQRVVENLGSNHNLSLIRLGSAKKCLFVEGDDIKTLSKFQKVLYPESTTSIDQLPSVELGGWSRFNEALGAARLFFEETKGEIETYCILDRDYHTDEEIESLYQKANESHLILHVWERKEIENYILNPKAIFKVANVSLDKYKEFCEELFKMLDSLYEETLSGIMDQLASRDKSKRPSSFYRAATTLLAPKWETLEGRLAVANGKKLISAINDWIRNNYNRNCSRAKLLSALTPDDLPQEMQELIRQLSS